MRLCRRKNGARRWASPSSRRATIPAHGSLAGGRGSAGLSRALLAVDPEVWWRAGGKPMLIIQPLQDPMSPRQSGIDAAEALGARYVEVPRCGHAILPEQPEAIADAVIAFLREQEALAPA